ncbi:unnamed protein product [Heligmosomoides polygyrus]|uniref:Coilin n=1 Tax=Heligmosomoides polygyrus TaxID=6339 RepID=A0A183GPQ3_HELPZ|nr:unnamed protein product [Heligmosomoides polygyrus]
MSRLLRFDEMSTQNLDARLSISDSNWKICDMFAVTAATAPFTLVAYDGRDYLEYLAAIPPSDDELTNANVLTTQEQAMTSKRHKLSCESSSVEKPPSVRPEKSGGATHGAVSSADQLKAAESGTMRREKALEKEERKLRKLTRSPVQATTSPGPTSAQVAMFDEVNRIAMLPETSTNAAASSMNKRLEGKFSVIHANDSMLLSKNHDRIKPGEVENSKIKGGRRKQATMSKVEETRELSDDLVPEKKSLSAEIAEWEEMLRKREEEKVIRRKPARATSVTPESLTTTGTPEGLSADIARLKIEAYQQRKAAEATAFAVHPPRRRIRLEGSRLVGDALDESELRRNKGVTGSQSKAVAKHDNRSGDEPEQKEPEQPASEAAKSAGRPKRRRTKKQRKTTATSPAATTVEARATTTNPSSAAATATTATTAAASDPEHLRDEIRIALSREIKKYITKELKEKVSCCCW